MAENAKVARPIPPQLQQIFTDIYPVCFPNPPKPKGRGRPRKTPQIPSITEPLTQILPQLLERVNLEICSSDEPVQGICSILLSFMATITSLQAQIIDLKEQLEEWEEESSATSVVGNATEPGPPTAEEIEHDRSVIIVGLPETEQGTCRDKWARDQIHVSNMVKLMDIEAQPVSVYRLGKQQPNKSRLVKVVFPSHSH